MIYTKTNKKVAVSTIPSYSCRVLMDRGGLEEDLRAVSERMGLEAAVLLGPGDMAVFPAGSEAAGSVKKVLARD